MLKRNIEIKLRLTENEAAVLYHDVEKSGLSREAYLRCLIRKMPIRERPPLDLIEVLRNLSQINNNMNQIAAKANSIGFIDTSAYWKNVRLLEDTIRMLTEEMYG